jgi:hypothetical protein
VFTIRGWMLTVIGALLAAYYTENITLDKIWVQIGLPVLAVLFLLVESRHANIVEAASGRATELENEMVAARHPDGTFKPAWYNGPKIGEICREASSRGWPRMEMTFFLNLPFYIVVIAVIVVVTIFLPERKEARNNAPSASQTAGR